MPTTLVNVKKKLLIQNGYKDFEDWKKNINHMYIGRDMTFYVKGTNGSKWSNPYKVKKYGVDKALELYKNFVLNNKELLDSLDELEGKVLGCWCVTSENKKCHGQILIELLKMKKEGKLK
jgi:hypothetical protein